MIANNTIYCLNGAAVGDLVAAAPVVKWAIETFHKKTDYRVAVYPDFREIFHFVPEDKFTDVKADYPKNFSVRKLNALRTGNNHTRLVPSRVKLGQYASIGLTGRVLPDDLLKYVPLPTVDVSKYGVDFSKAVIIITTYRDKQRVILPKEILKIAEYVQSKGLIPVYVGRTGTFSIWKNHPAISDFEYPGFGADLRDKTTLSELYNIMRLSRAVIGMDSGPIHLAFATEVPVICGFTNINPNIRIPYRGLAKTIPVVPNIACNFCESDWSLDLWDFNECPRKMQLAECVTKMTSTKFIAALEALNIFDP